MPSYYVNKTNKDAKQVPSNAIVKPMSSGDNAVVTVLNNNDGKDPGNAHDKEVTIVIRKGNDSDVAAVDPAEPDDAVTAREQQPHHKGTTIRKKKHYDPDVNAMSENFRLASVRSVVKNGIVGTASNDELDSTDVICDKLIDAVKRNDDSLDAAQNRLRECDLAEFDFTAATGAGNKRTSWSASIGDGVRDLDKWSYTGHEGVKQAPNPLNDTLDYTLRTVSDLKRFNKDTCNLASKIADVLPDRLRVRQVLALHLDNVVTLGRMVRELHRDIKFLTGE
eukprot:CAMPEP_0172516136 /NCGR_PEP_ID=MMETSP1066-20121228/273616_1 /TAXON_ID=671091 /ORGANISM="Coscinodiscus wailesii, Strain CCMP2513" /LENGTH=278 /DNA_ID=CAMNT_0013297487 /DNA_START=122 /DNA_END=955 /DNA_ORIENTATION=+